MHEEDTRRYEELPEEILNRFIFTECNEPLIVPVAFNKHGEKMKKSLHKLLGDSMLKINPSMDEVIVSLKSAKCKPSNPYALDKNTSSFHDTLDALRLAVCAYS